MDEAGCLERLVEQRSHRISYTRLLSWEKSPEKPTRPRRKLKNRKPETLEVKKDSSDFIVLDISQRSDKSLQSIETESMEYNTSSESESDDWSDAFDDDSGENDTDINADGEKNINTFDELSNENEEFRSKDTDSNCSSLHQTRAPSKKQKRKRRFKRKMYWNNHYPLPYIDDNLELSGVKEDIHESDLSVRKKVPSLAELCLMSSKGLVSESNTLCKAFRKMYRDIFTETTFHKNQLKWLFYVLSCLEQEEENQVNGIKYKPITRWVHHIDKDGLSDKKCFFNVVETFGTPNYI
ncbi:unnamed protein product [Mytilus coruscus]|uniref:Uncharacterized protein n=1 Tax=Mytilus coruscus TaxID=42192 RepID=A0A6J8AZQ0_MYTCO|nr:unnamed protein product [Mytilus coruscus]